MTIIAFQIDEFGTTGRTNDGQVLRSNTIPTFSFALSYYTLCVFILAKPPLWVGELLRPVHQSPL